MAVEINIDLDAGKAQSKIGALQAHLNTLRATSTEGFDLDLDGIEDISDSIREISDELEELDDHFKSIEKRSQRISTNISDMDTVKVSTESPDGDTNAGDSTGGDPPSGRSRSAWARRVLGDATVMSKEDAYNLSPLEPSGGQSNLKHADPNFLSTFNQRTGSRQEGFGVTPFSRQFKRLADSIDEAEFTATAEMPEAEPEGLRGRIERSDIISDSLEDIKEQQRKLRESARLGEDGGDRDTFPNTYKDFNQDIRDDWLSDQERASLANPMNTFADNPFGGDGDNTTSRMDSRKRIAKSLNKWMGKLGDKHKRLGKHLRKLKPSMSMVYSIIAAVLPIAIALGTALLGMAAAFAAVAAAGAAMGGLGLLGDGDSMAESIQNAKKDLKDLKEELFDAAQPALQAFAPVQDRMFAAIPGQVAEIADEMERLTVFEDTFFQLGGMLSAGMQKAIDAIVENEEAISQLAVRFADLAGSAIFDFFSFLFKEAKKNQGLLVNLGGDIKKLIKTIYHLSVAISTIASTFSPLFTIILFIAKLMENKLIATLVSAVGWMYVLSKSAVVIYSMAKGFAVLAKMVVKAAGRMWLYIANTWGAVAATLALASALAMVTLGISAIAGSIGSMTAIEGGGVPNGAGTTGAGATGAGATGAGGGQVYNDNRQYTINAGGSANDYATLKDVEDTIRKTDQAGAAKKRPSVASDTESSD